MNDTPKMVYPSTQETLIRYWAEKNGIDDLGQIVKNYQRTYAAVEGSKTTEQTMDEIVKDNDMSTVAKQAAQLEEQRARDLRTKFLTVLDQAIENAHTTGEYETEGNVKFS